MKLYWSCSQAGAEQEQAAPVEGFWRYPGAKRKDTVQNPGTADCCRSAHAYCACVRPVC